MNIKTAQNTFKKAATARDSGNNLLAARLFLAAQQEAMQCRSVKRFDIIDFSHLGAAMRSAAIISDALSSHAEKSEAGRIRAESQYLYNGKTK